MEQLKNLLEITLPILAGILIAGAQRAIQWYKIKRFKLEDHPLFTDLSLKINTINSWVFACNRRALKDALVIKLKLWKDRGTELAKELQKGIYSNMQLENIVIQWAMKVVNEYTEEWRKTNIPEILIQRITTNHQVKVNSFVEEIKGVCRTNDMYYFKGQKVIAIFDTLRLLLAETVIDFNELIYQAKYNGELKGLIYKDYPINDDEYKEFVNKQKQLKIKNNE